MVLTVMGGVNELAKDMKLIQYDLNVFFNYLNFFMDVPTISIIDTKLD